MRPHVLPILLLAAGLAFVAGCGRNEPIRVYRAPKGPTWRMLGAIIPRPDQTWFFKLTGTSGRILPHRDDFLKFLDSVRFAEGGPKWTLPAGWHEEAKSGERYATLCIGTTEPHLELAVSSLQADGGGILANVNRWRDQMGLEKIVEGDLAKATSVRTVEGVSVTVVDLEGLRRPAGPPAAARAKPEPSRGEVSMETIRGMFTFSPPAGWVENPRPERGRIFEWSAGETRVTLNVLSGAAGGLGANVNRWRGQVGLQTVDDAAAHDLVRALPFLGGDGSWIELFGKERGMMIAFRLNAEFSIFLKMEGPADAVRAQKTTFENFVVSSKISH